MPHFDSQTQIALSLFHTQSEVGQELFYSVLRAGHIITGSEYRIERDHYPGHEILFCLKGKGLIYTSNRHFAVEKGQVAWIDCGHPHAHWPDKESPWEVYWLRVEGVRLALIYDLLLRQNQAAVFAGIDKESVKRIYEDIFEILQKPYPAMEATLHARVATLIALLFEVVFRSQSELTNSSMLPGRLYKCVETMRLYYHRPLKMPELARMAGLSDSHFFRLFKKATGMTPLQWLKRERINQAKRRLIETDDPIAEVAEQTGYSDEFYFSRDFKRVTRMAPSEYRTKERLHK